jgi:hypothetical protein
MNDTKYFQWLAGDRRGEIVLFDKIIEDDNLTFVSFKDGSRCNVEFILPLNEKDFNGKMMAEIEHPNNCWMFNEKEVGGQEEKWAENQNGEQVCVQPYMPGKKITVPIPPKPSMRNFKTLNSEVIYQAPTTKITPPPENIKPKDEVYLLLDKAKKIDTEINFIISLPLPTAAFYNVINDSFENGGEKLAEYIIENMDIDILKSFIKTEILNMYNKNNSNNE